MYANAVVTVHEDFDIVKFAETFFDTGKQCLIVKEKGGTKLHWHVHGIWKDPKEKEAYKLVPHALRKGEGRSKTRPVQVAFDKDEKGFQYCCKEDPVHVVKQWHITDEQISEWHRLSEQHNADQNSKLKRALSNVPQNGAPAEYFRDLKRAAYDYTIAEQKLIHPARLASYVVTAMYSTDSDAYKSWILDHK